MKETSMLINVGNAGAEQQSLNKINIFYTCKCWYSSIDLE